MHCQAKLCILESHDWNAEHLACTFQAQHNYIARDSFAGFPLEGCHLMILGNL